MMKVIISTSAESLAAYKKRIAQETALLKEILTPMRKSLKEIGLTCGNVGVFFRYWAGCEVKPPIGKYKVFVRCTSGNVRNKYQLSLYNSKTRTFVTSFSFSFNNVESLQKKLTTLLDKYGATEA